MMRKNLRDYLFPEPTEEDYEIAGLLYEHILEEIPRIQEVAPPKLHISRAGLIKQWAVDLHPFFIERTHARVKNVILHHRALYIRKKGQGVPTLLNAYDFRNRFDGLERSYLWDQNPVRPEKTALIMRELLKLKWSCSKEALETAVGQSYATYKLFLLGCINSGVEPVLLERLREVFPSVETFLIDYFTKFNKRESGYPIWSVVVASSNLEKRARDYFRRYGLSEERNEEVMTAIMESVAIQERDFAIKTLKREVEAEKARKAKKSGDST